MKPEWLPRDIMVATSDAEKDAVRVAQRLFRMVPTGNLDEPTRASLRGLQRQFHLEVTGILDEGTAVVIDRLRPWRLREEQ